MKKYAQAISEYVVLVAVVAAALTLMQIYFRRSIQSVIKIAADEAGGQKQGSASQDYNLVWIEKESTMVNTTSSARNTETRLLGAAVERTVSETVRQRGGISLGVTREKE